MEETQPLILALRLGQSDPAGSQRRADWVTFVL